MIVFDDLQAAAFYPLTLSRSVGDLRCGILKLRQRLQELLHDEDNSVWIETSLVRLYQERHPDWSVNQHPAAEALWVNSRLRPLPGNIEAVQNLKSGECLVCGNEPVAFRGLPAPEFTLAADYFAQAGYKIIALESCLYRNLSDLIQDNARMLAFDFDRFFHDKDEEFDTEPGVMVLNPYQVWIAEDVQLKPGVVLDASEGPIVVDSGVRILPNSIIMGPAYIGKSSLIKAGAKIYGGTSIGPVCKVGGEVEGSIFQAYSNKQHDGFLGHSFIGEWVNIGADTNNSDLKNTYKNVAFHSYLENARIDSGTMFLGTMVGDHTKLGINCSINTGCVIGVGCNLWDSNLISDFIPDFSWGPARELTAYRFDAFCQVAATVKSRRGLSFTDAEAELYSRIHAARLAQI